MRQVLLFCVVGLLLAADDPKPEDKAAKEIEGAWQGVSAEDARFKGGFSSVWTIKEGTITSTRRGMKSQLKYRVDAAKTPRQIDLTFEGGPAAGKTLKGIFKIDKDTLTVCYVRVGVTDPEKRDRPTEFDVKKRDDLVILTFQRK